MAKKVKIRTLSNGSILGTLLLAVFCVLISVFGFEKYNVLRSATQDYITCETAARSLQNGSDILTKRARLAASSASKYYIDSYFEEAETIRTREKALQQLAQLESNTNAIEQLREALSYSIDLMTTEYHSMRLVEEAIHNPSSEWPQQLRDYRLNDKEKNLSDSEKLRLAEELLISQSYETTKEKISADINSALTLLADEIINRQNQAADTFSRVFRTMFVCIILFAVMMLLSGLIMRYWIVRPILHCTDSIRHGLIFPIRGVNEIQILADTYNKVYQENEERERLMKHQADHDPLTQLLNRGSFDRILDMYEKDESDFALILIDVDTFKSVNDTYGHATGDQILKKVSAELTTAFRSIDHICRIGGDEFAVIMVNMTSDLAYTITDKITDINRELSNPDDGLPAVSLSVGAAFTDREDPGPDLFKDADKALYYTKEHGRHGCHIYPVKPEETTAE